MRAEEKAAAPKPAAEKAPEPWSPPTLNPDTPSPIFGGSTGGLLRKAQVRPPAAPARRWQRALRVLRRHRAAALPRRWRSST